MAEETQPVISVRNLQEPGTPLRKFYGVLESFPHEQSGYGKTRVSLNFTQVQVIESTEPYPFPIATLAINLSNRKNSSWGVFGESLIKCLPENADIDSCIGKKVGMEMEVGHKFGTNQDGDEMLGNCWKVFEVAGVVAGAKQITAKDKAVALLDGKNIQEHTTLALANPQIRSDIDLQKAIVSKVFYNSLLQSGMFTKDEQGIYHKAQVEEIPF